MKTPRPPTICAVALVCACLAPTGLEAGESIQFSNARHRADPTAKSKLPLGKQEEGGGVSPLDNLPQAPHRRDPQAERKAKNAAAERANWMVLDRGQLDKEDEEKRAFGLRDTSLEKEEDPDRKDYFFTPREDKDGSRVRSQFVRPSGRDLSSGRAKEPAGDGAKEGDESQRAGSGKDGQPAGETAVKDLDLKELLSPGKANSLAPAVDKTTLMWREVFGSGASEARADTARRRDESSAADTYRSAAPTARRENDALTFRKDTAPSSITPAPRGFSDSAPRQFTAPSAPLAPRSPDATFNRSAFPNAASPSASDAFNSRNAGSAADPYPAYRPATQPQRNTPGSYQIPQRPGYGNGR